MSDLDHPLRVLSGRAADYVLAFQAINELDPLVCVEVLQLAATGTLGYLLSAADRAGERERLVDVLAHIIATTD